MSEQASPVTAIIVSSEFQGPAEAELFASMPTRLVRRTGVEVRDNWIIDRDFGTVRRRYWGPVDPNAEIERC